MQRRFDVAETKEVKKDENFIADTATGEEKVEIDATTSDEIIKKAKKGISNATAENKTINTESKCLSIISRII